MLAILGPKASLDFIPAELEAEIREDVMEAYYAASQNYDVICLDENIVHMLSFQYMSILYFYEFGSILDPAIRGDQHEWRYLHDRYPIENHQTELKLFREEVKTILMESQMFFEENWAFSATEPKDYIFERHNSPLQSVW